MAPLRIAFADIVNPGWTAGAHYYANLFTALRELDASSRPELVVVRRRKRIGGYQTYEHLADHVLDLPGTPRRGFVTRQWRRARRRIGASETQPIEQLLHEQNVDALFACWSEFGPSFDVPLLGWITDFNHVRRPGTHPAPEERYRDELFSRMAANCSRIVLSSEDARRDFEEFAPAFTDKARVLQFVARVPADVYDSDPTRVCAEYHLPERFVYLPNQFWAHKNHELVVEALARMSARRPEVTVVCTGNPSDNRDPLHFAKLLSRHLGRAGVRDRFVVLGWVPHDHIYALMRQSVVVLQPSLFEGWSTTVEEAKSIGKTVLLSDIPVHREQAPPAARDFDPADADQLAGCLEAAYDSCTPGPDHALEAQARVALPERTRAYADAFIDIVRDAMAR